MITMLARRLLGRRGAHAYTQVVGPAQDDAPYLRGKQLSMAGDTPTPQIEARRCALAKSNRGQPGPNHFSGVAGTATRRDLVRHLAIAGLAASTAVYAIPGHAAAEGDAAIADVRDHGAKGDGAADDTSAFRAAIHAARPGGLVLIPASPAPYRITGTLKVPNDITIEALGHAVISVPAGANFPVFDLDGAANATLRGLHLVGGGVLDHSSRGVLVRGEAANILLDRLQIGGFGRGIDINGSAGTTPSTVHRVIVRECTSHNSPASFGMNVEHADSIMLENCYAHHNWLDGVKLRAHTRNVTIRGGAYYENGQARLSGGPIGDGIDAFAGGDTLLIEGVICDNNHGNGIVIKTDTLTRDEAEVYGYVRNVQVIAVRCRHNNPGSGLGFYTWPPDGDDVPLVAHGTILGGYFEGNQNYGVYIDARNLAVTAPVVRLNGRTGIHVGRRSMFVSIANPVVVANSQIRPGQYHGIYVGGGQISVSGGSVVGADADRITNRADYEGLPKHHAYNVLVSSGAGNCLVQGVLEAYALNTPGIWHVK